MISSQLVILIPKLAPESERKRSRSLAIYRLQDCSMPIPMAACCFATIDSVNCLVCKRGWIINGEMLLFLWQDKNMTSLRLDFVHDDYRETVRRTLKDALDGHRTEQVDFVFLNGNWVKGYVRWWERGLVGVSGYPITKEKQI